MVVIKQGDYVTIEIYFSDLNPAAKRDIMDAYGISDPAEMNWDMDIFPVATTYVTVEEDLE